MFSNIALFAIVLIILAIYLGQTWLAIGVAISVLLYIIATASPKGPAGTPAYQTAPDWEKSSGEPSVGPYPSWAQITGTLSGAGEAFGLTGKTFLQLDKGIEKYREKIFDDLMTNKKSKGPSDLITVLDQDGRETKVPRASYYNQKLREITQGLAYVDGLTTLTAAEKAIEKTKLKDTLKKLKKDLDTEDK